MKSSSKGPTISNLCDLLSQLTHSIRLLLEYTDSSYEEKRYVMGDGNDTFLVRHLLSSYPGIPVPSPCFLSSADLLQLEEEGACSFQEPLEGAVWFSTH